MTKFTKGQELSDEELIIRWVIIDHIEEDDSIHPEAFRPSPKDYDDGVSVEPFVLFTDQQIQRHRFAQRGMAASILKAKVPNHKGYTVKFTHKKHAVINADVRRLAQDEQALLDIANSASLLYNPVVDHVLRSL